MIAIYSISPTPNGDEKRLVEFFDKMEYAVKVLEVLESVNVSFNYYLIEAVGE